MGNSFENLVRIGELKEEEPRADELEGLRLSSISRLVDAERVDLSFESRFDLAYNAAHSLALLALRKKGYRPKTRYIVFQLLPETAGLEAKLWRVMAKAHELRNRSEGVPRPECRSAGVTKRIAMWRCSVLHQMSRTALTDRAFRQNGSGV